MLTEQFQQIDWQRPWLEPWRASGQRVIQAVAGGAALPDALNRESDLTIKFVPQSDLPPGMGYEHYLFQSSQCPTRDNLHDFFNGLCWLRFPQTKAKINQIHAAEFSRDTAGAVFDAVSPLRGPVRDALTVFDENAAFLLAPQPLWDALVDRDWQRLFVELRPLWKGAQLVLFGHALLEKLVYPRKPITAHVYRAQPAIHSIAELDAWVAADLSAVKLASKPFVPLPVLGIPGWWAENELFSFYDDALVFRPRNQNR